MFYVAAYYEIILDPGALVSRIHTVKNVSHLMDMSGKELIHDKLINESMGKSPSKDPGSQYRRPGGCGIMAVYPIILSLLPNFVVPAIVHASSPSYSIKTGRKPRADGVMSCQDNAM